ncbi:MAG: BlaI/MecI/CopY family transcriptional regulator [Gemmatimonadota bacterium]
MTYDPTLLSRLERNLLETLYRLGEASASEVASAMPPGTSEDSVRVTLGKLEKRGILTHRSDGPRHIYRPTVPADAAAAKALRHLLSTYFAGASSKAVLTLLDLSSNQLDETELDEIADWIEAEREDDE